MVTVAVAEVVVVIVAMVGTVGMSVFMVVDVMVMIYIGLIVAVASVLPMSMRHHLLSKVCICRVDPYMRMIFLYQFTLLAL